MEKKSTIKSTKINTAGNQTCLNQSGLGMMFDQSTGQCILGRVGKKIRNITEATNSLSSNPMTVYMNDDTLKIYMLDKPGKKPFKIFLNNLKFSTIFIENILIKLWYTQIYQA